MKRRHGGIKRDESFKINTWIQSGPPLNIHKTLCVCYENEKMFISKKRHKTWKFLKWRLRKDNQPNNIQLPNYKYYICFGGKIICIMQNEIRRIETYTKTIWK